MWPERFEPCYRRMRPYEPNNRLLLYGRIEPTSSRLVHKYSILHKIWSWEIRTWGLWNGTPCCIHWARRLLVPCLCVQLLFCKKKVSTVFNLNFFFFMFLSNYFRKQQDLAKTKLWRKNNIVYNILEHFSFFFQTSCFPNFPNPEIYLYSILYSIHIVLYIVLYCVLVRVLPYVKIDVVIFFTISITNDKPC